MSALPMESGGAYDSNAGRGAFVDSQRRPGDIALDRYRQRGFDGRFVEPFDTAYGLREFD
jgi:hypothetical protein